MNIKVKYEGRQQRIERYQYVSFGEQFESHLFVNK